MNAGRANEARRIALLVIHLIAIGLSVLLLGYITYDTLQNVSFLADPRYLSLQLKVCLYFIFDVVMSWVLSSDRKHGLAGDIVFLAICVPWLSLIDLFGWHVAGEIQYLLRFLPMIRAAYVVALVAGFISTNKLANLFRTYIVLLVTTIYFGSLMFYVAEHYVNVSVASYWDALWWTVMDMTTAGSSITPVTATGRTLSVVLSAEGLILFPVFTVYFTSALTGSKSQQESDSSGS